MLTEWWSEIVFRVRAVVRRRAVEEELDAELRFHLEREAEKYVRRGVSPDEAVRKASRAMGGLDRTKEATRAVRGTALLDAFAQDLRYAVRGLRRSPGLALTIVITLALGVGANAAVFSVLDRVFLQAPPGVARPDEVRRVYVRQLPWGARSSAMRYVHSALGYPDFANLHDAARGQAAVEGYEDGGSVPLGDSTTKVRLARVTPGYFELLGVHPARGRFFSPGEHDFTNPVRVAILGHALWRRAYGSDPGVVGRTIRLADTTFTIVGVAPRAFEGVDLDVMEVWVPLASRGLDREFGRWWERRGTGILQLLARLKPGTDARALDVSLTTAYRRANVGQAEFDTGGVVLTAPLLEALGPRPGGMGRNMSLATRLGGVGVLVLLVATSNVASLLLMRALRRRREIAVHLALGMSRRRLVSQLLTESMLLAAIAGAVALLIGGWSGALLRKILLPQVHWSAAVVDDRFVILVAAVTAVAGILAGCAPASLALRADLATVLKSATTQGGRAKSPLRAMLLVAQSAVCVVLLAGAGVLAQSLRRAMNTDLGFDADRVISVLVNLRAPQAATAEEVVRRIGALPSVQSVAEHFGSISGGGVVAKFKLPDGDTLPELEAPHFGLGDSAYFRALGFRVLTGRRLDARDRAGTDPVAVIGESMARQYWPGRDPLGACFYTIWPGRPPCRRVVGIVHDIRHGVSTQPRALYFIPASQYPWPSHGSFAVRTRGRASASTVAAIQPIIAQLAAGTRAPTVRRMVDVLDPQLHPWKVAAALFLLFGALALVSAASGVYGLAAYDVTQRTREIGVRIALGATARSVLGLVLGSGVRVVLLGVGVGVAAAVASGRVMASLLYDTSPYDPTVLATTALTLLGVAFLAGLIPAWRATRVDPVIALRAE